MMEKPLKATKGIEKTSKNRYFRSKKLRKGHVNGAQRAPLGAKESGINVMLSGQDTKQLEKSLETLTHPQPGLMRMISRPGAANGSLKA